MNRAAIRLQMRANYLETGDARMSKNDLVIRIQELERERQVCMEKYSFFCSVKPRRTVVIERLRKQAAQLEKRGGC